MKEDCIVRVLPVPARAAADGRDATCNDFDVKPASVRRAASSARNTHNLARPGLEVHDVASLAADEGLANDIETVAETCTAGTSSGTILF